MYEYMSVVERLLAKNWLRYACGLGRASSPLSHQQIRAALALFKLRHLAGKDILTGFPKALFWHSGPSEVSSLGPLLFIVV